MFELYDCLWFMHEKRRKHLPQNFYSKHTFFVPLALGSASRLFWAYNLSCKCQVIHPFRAAGNDIMTTLIGWGHHRSMHSRSRVTILSWVTKVHIHFMPPRTGKTSILSFVWPSMEKDAFWVQVMSDKGLNGPC